MTEQNNTPEHAQDNKLNGNDAVNLAAEQSKETAHRNIPELGFEDMPCLLYTSPSPRDS